MADDELEYAEARRVQVLETNVLHASDVIYWLNGATAENEADMQRLDDALSLRFFTKPHDAKVINSAGKTAFLRKPVNDMVVGVASEADKTRPDMENYSVSGEVRDSHRRFNPTRFDLTLGAGAGHSVVLYPSPSGTARAPGGLLYGSLLLDGDESPLSWALLELEVSVSGSDTQTYRAQSDAAGDFSIALTRLPPLPESISVYHAVLRVTANVANTADAAPDTDTYSPMHLQAGSNNDFNAEYALSITPGGRLRVNSNDKNYLAASTT